MSEKNQSQKENQIQSPIAQDSQESRVRDRIKLLVRASLEHNSVWREIPVSSREFFEKYLGEPCYPEQQTFIDKMLGADPLEWDVTYQEGMALVGKGGGKDRAIAKLLVYLCYKIECLIDLQAFFDNASVDIVNISLNAKLAKRVFFKYFTTFVKRCRIPAVPGQRDADRKNWFVKHGLDLKRDILDREVTFPNGLTCHSLDSTEYSFEGLNVIFAVLDEVGGFIPAKAREIYDAVTDTQTSRSKKYMKTLLLSYPRDPNDFMVVHYNESKNDSSVYRVKATTWDWNIRKKKSDFVKQYTSNPERARRVYECECESGKGGYFKYKEQLQYIVNYGGMENPIVDDLLIVKSLKAIRFKKFFSPVPGAKYRVHVDTAKGKEGGDAAGFAMGHYVPKMAMKLSPDHIRKLKDLEGIDLSSFSGRESIGVRMDLAFQIRAPRGGEIIFDDILEFIIYLKHVLKFNIVKVTFDGYQSLSLIQNLKRAGIDSEELSVDRTSEPYDSLKSVIYRGVLDSYPNFVVLRELEELIVDDRGKVDHPSESYRRSMEEGDKRGSKDVADAEAGVVHGCLSEIPPEVRFWVSSQPGPVTGSTPEEIQKSNQERLVRYGERPR